MVNILMVPTWIALWETFWDKTVNHIHPICSVLYSLPYLLVFFRFSPVHVHYLFRKTEKGDLWCTKKRHLRIRPSEIAVLTLVLTTPKG